MMMLIKLCNLQMILGGGILAFMMIGKPPIMITNEIIVPICIVIWLLILKT